MPDGDLLGWMTVYALEGKGAMSVLREFWALDGFWGACVCAVSSASFKALGPGAVGGVLRVWLGTIIF